MVAGLEGLEPHYDFVIVGAGLSGFVFAEQAAARFGYTSLIIDKRDHIGAPPCPAQLSPQRTACTHSSTTLWLSRHACVRPGCGDTGEWRHDPASWGHVARLLQRR